MAEIKSNYKCDRFLKIFIPLIIFLSIIYLLQSGYKTGQWLYEFLQN